MTLRSRFESKYVPEPNSGCWLWDAGINSKGYGQIRDGKRMRLAHRLSFEFYKGEFPADSDILHHCDMPLCVNPDHLFLGTHQDNMSDMKNKGRARTCKGETHKRSKLTDDLVRQIRQSKEKNKIWAEKLGVSSALIGMVKRRTIWKHI